MKGQNFKFFLFEVRPGFKRDGDNPDNPEVLYLLRLRGDSIVQKDC